MLMRSTYRIYLAIPESKYNPIKIFEIFSGFQGSCIDMYEHKIIRRNK